MTSPETLRSDLDAREDFLIDLVRSAGEIARAGFARADRGIRSTQSGQRWGRCFPRTGIIVGERERGCHPSNLASAPDMHPGYSTA